MNQPELLGESNIDKRLQDFFASSQSRWTKLYAPSMQTSTGVQEHFEKKIKARQPTLIHVRKYTPNNGKILESASGTGALSLQLSNEGYECSTLEQDADMNCLSEMIQEVCGGTVNRHQGNFFRLPFSDNSFDTVFNQGVLEYFDDSTVKQIIQEQLRVGQRFIFGVPTILNNASYIEDDEILRSYWHWKKLILDSNAKIIDSYSYFSYRKVRAMINKILGMNLQPFSPSVGFVVEKNT